jgi:hypothetical protein
MSIFKARLHEKAMERNVKTDLDLPIVIGKLELLAFKIKGKADDMTCLIMGEGQRGMQYAYNQSFIEIKKLIDELKGGEIAENIDPSNEEGCPGADGITDYGYGGASND